MKELKLLLAGSLLFGFGIGAAACDVDDSESDCNEAGVCGEAGAGGDGAGATGGDVEPAVEYNWVVIVDSSADENMAGTPGVDICGVVFNCGADDFPPDQAGGYVQGEGLVCDGSSMDAPCESGTARNDETAAADDGSACDPGSSPSDYVSLGMAGQIALDAGVDLQGCTVNIVELDGGSTPNESYSVYICPTDTLDDTCLGGASVADSPMTGGSISVEIPAAEAPAEE